MNWHEGRRVWFSENVLEDQINLSVKMKLKARLLGGRLLGSVARKENRKEGQPRPGINSKIRISGSGVAHLS